MTEAELVAKCQALAAAGCALSAAVLALVRDRNGLLLTLTEVVRDGPWVVGSEVRQTVGKLLASRETYRANRGQSPAPAGCGTCPDLLAAAAERDRAVESLRTFRRLAGALADRLGAEADAIASRAASAAVASG